MQDDGSWASNREIANAIHKWPQEIANNLCDGKAALVGIRRSKEHEIKIADNPIESFLMNWVTLQADWDCKPVSCGYSCKFKWKIVDTLDLEIAKQKSSSYTADIALAWTAEIIGTHYYDPRNGVGIWKRWWTRRPALNGFEAFDWEVQMKDTQERLWCDYSRALRQK